MNREQEIMKDFFEGLETRRIEVRMPETKEAIGQVRMDLRNFMRKYGLAQAAIAKAIGASLTSVSQFLNSKYPGDERALAGKLASYINTYESRAGQAGPKGFVETTVAKRIFGLIKQAEKFTKPTEGRIGLVICDAGGGKSACLLAYSQANPNSIYVKLNDTMSSKAMFEGIAEALGLDMGGSLKVLTDRLSRHLKSREMTVLLDEASGLDVRKLNQLRQIVSENGCAMILAGNGYLLKTINLSTVQRGNEALDQFRSRMLAVLNLDLLTADRDGGGGLYTPEDIRKLYEYGGLRLTGSGVAALRKMCLTPQTGRLRTCSIIIEAIHNTAQVKSGEIKEIDAELIIDAIGLLGLPIADRLPFTPAELKEEYTTAAVKTA
jgi:DNA transposition AAA+ family ATPase